MARLRDQVASDLDLGKDFSVVGADLWDDLSDLFDLIERGGARYGVPQYNGGLFSANQHPFLTRKKLADRHLALVIDQLSRSRDPNNIESGLFRVDYRDLAIRELGSIYEGLLELSPDYASESLRIVRPTGASHSRTAERFVPLSADIPLGFRDTGRRVNAGSIYMVTSKGERSYFRQLLHTGPRCGSDRAGNSRAVMSRDTERSRTRKRR